MARKAKTCFVCVCVCVRSQYHAFIDLAIDASFMYPRRFEGLEEASQAFHESAEAVTSRALPQSSAPGGGI